mgnify:CR=1 FL=1
MALKRRVTRARLVAQPFIGVVGHFLGTQILERKLGTDEFSGTVRNAFAARGHDAWSCDLLPTEIVLVLLAILLAPVVNGLQRLHLPKTLAAILAELGYEAETIAALRRAEVI